MRQSQAAEKRNLQLYSPWTFPPLKMRILCCIETSGSQLISNAASHPRRKECPPTPLENIKTGKALIQVILSFTIATSTVKITKNKKGNTLLVMFRKLSVAVYRLAYSYCKVLQIHESFFE